jgi:hemerythrin-like domain-containing protein
MRTYADRCHHGKEEDILFAKLRSKDMTPPMKQAMERLIEEHALARSLVRRLEDLTVSCRPGNPDTSKGVQQVITEITMLYPDHIRREDKEFFPTAMTYLEPKESQVMLEQFEDFEHRILHEKYEALVKGVEKR